MKTLSQRMVTVIVIIGMLAFGTAITSQPPQQTPVGFNVSVLEGTNIGLPTALQFGADGRLYAADRDGRLYIYAVTRIAPNVYRVIGTEILNNLLDIGNHNDDGTVQAHPQRQVTGMFVAGTAQNPVIFTTSGDWRDSFHIEVHDFDSGVDTNSGVISRITWDGAAWQRLDLVRGLPRGVTNHAPNGLVLDPETNRLYVAIGGLTNMGAPFAIADPSPEFAYSSAILSVDLSAIGETTYDLPTLDDPTRPGNPDDNDPFGGNGGLNQAILLPDSPVQVYSPGYRNAYDVIIASTGKIYATNNGGNTGWGAPPIDCSNQPSVESYATIDTSLHLVYEGYYAGHPNPARGSSVALFNGQFVVPQPDPRECTFLSPQEVNAIAQWNGSVNGLTEYIASNFDGAMQGDLLTASVYGMVERIKLDATGEHALSTETLFNNTGGYPIDLTALGDDSPFPGTIWLGDYGQSQILVYEPVDYRGAVTDAISAEFSFAIDADGDGFSNADEILNQTDPSNAANLPADRDDDQISDGTDDDDDSDGIKDADDAFALDPQNGRGTILPLSIDWDSGSTAGVGILGTGFTGMMTNGIEDYLDQFVAEDIIAGAAFGYLNIENISGGDAFAAENHQDNAFQIGFVSELPFTVTTRVRSPFFSGQQPQRNQALGAFIGTGDQDNYLKLIVNFQGLQVLIESEGAATWIDYPASLLTEEWVDLFMTVDETGAVSSRYRTSGGQAGDLGQPIAPEWLTRAEVLAVGIMSTSKEATPFTAIWDFLEVTAEYVPAFTEDAMTQVIEVPLQPTPAPQTAVDTSQMTVSSNLDLLEAARQPIVAVPVASVLPPSQRAANALDFPNVCAFRSGTSAPQATYEGTYVQHDGKIYAAGGFYVGLLATDAFYIYDLVSDSWTRGATLPEPVSHAIAIVDAQTDSMWLAGGFVGNHPGVATDHVWRYDIALDTWSPAPSLPQFRAGGAMIQIQRTLHYIGGVGIDRNTTVTDHWTLDMDDPTAAWQTSTPMLEARNHVMGVYWDDAIYMIGGQFKHDTAPVESFTAERYDLASDIWAFVAEMPTSISHLETGTFVHDDHILLFGGRTVSAGFVSTPRILAYDRDTDNWTVAGYLPARRFGHYAGVYGNEYVIAMGAVDLVYVYDTLWRGTPGMACASLNLTTPLPSLAVQNAGAAEAWIEINPGFERNSTYESGSFRIVNLSSGDQQITSARFNIDDALVGSAVFDENGVLGDVVGKPFTIDRADGVTVIDHQVDVTVLEVAFESFDAGDEFAFSIDVDPSELQGLPAPGPGDSGSIDGRELIGTTVRITFSDGSERTVTLGHLLNSDNGAVNSLETPETVPTLVVQAERHTIPMDDMISPTQATIQLSGAADSIVRLLVTRGLFHTDAQLQQPTDVYAINSIEGLQSFDLRLNANGSAVLPITLDQPGIYTLVASTLGENGATSALSNRVRMVVR